MKKNAMVQKDTMKFLKDLAANNNRDWFALHKQRYIDANNNMIAFADALLDEMSKHDKFETSTGKDSLFRIYRDVRFSNNKTPYHNYLSGGFSRARPKLRGTYYFHVTPGGTFLASGFWGPNPEDMKRIRQDIDYNYHDWNKLLTNKTLVKMFGTLHGEQLASAPRGYAKEHPAIHLLRYKQFILRRSFNDEEVYGSSFVTTANDTFKKMRPFLDHMTEVLTTDVNGVSYFD